MKRKTLSAIVLLAGTIIGSDGQAQEPKEQPAIRIRLTHPDEQLQEVLGWFKDTKAANPAAALAAWKRASKEPNRLGKPLEALISSLNPKMVDELKTLDDAEVTIRFNPETGQPEWSAILPKDDGTFSALASALVLSGGSAEAPMGEIAVDRLAGPGSPLMAKVAGGTLLSSDRAGLKEAKARLEAPFDPLEKALSKDGLEIVIERGSLKGAKSLIVRRFEEFIRPVTPLAHEIKCLGEADFAFSLGKFSTTISYIDLQRFPDIALDPAWFDWTPKDQVVASFALAADPSAKSWQSLFELADRIEKLDSSKSNVASLQVRIDLLARLAGLRLETDLLSHLRGISGWVGTDAKLVSHAVVIFHLDDPDAAERVASGLKPLPGSNQRPVGEPEHPRWLGQVEGRALRVTRSERSVVIGWGDGAIEASLKARDDPDRSSGASIRDLLLEEKSWVSGIFWPGRVPALVPSGLPLKEEQSKSSPIVCEVAREGGLGLSLSLEWREMDEFVKLFLESLPLDPPPDH